MNWRTWGTAAASVSLLAVMSGGATAQSIPLEGIVVTSTKTSALAIDALSGTSSVGKEQIGQTQAGKASQLLTGVPGVTFSETPTDPAQSINIRGLMDFGRVNVLIEGARQNFQRSGHNANGSFYLDPEMLQSVDITRGPTATVYGSGAIGGVVAFSLLDADDILRPGEYAALRHRVVYTSNGGGILGSETAAMKVGTFDILGQINGRNIGDYTDGSGREIQYSGSDSESGMLKARWRPAPGHQITGTYVNYNASFTNFFEAALRGSDVHNEQYTLGYTFARPDVPLVDFRGKVYRTATNLAQTHLGGSLFEDLGEAIGSTRAFDIVTEGFDVTNTSRFSGAGIRWALTYGVDGFRDTVDVTDDYPPASVFTPSGERSVYGAFVQSQATLLEKLEIIAALRYDSYELDGGDTHLEGSRVSPKITVGYSAFKGVTLFGTYAEGYRAPSITETLIDGIHPPVAPFPIVFTPNPNLRPEVAHNFEAGVNFKFDGILRQGDMFRGRVVAFRNKVDDFIDGVETLKFGPRGPIEDVFQYQNIAKATLEGVELEGMYDAKAWFFGLAAHHIRGTNEETGEGLYSVPADKLTLTAGIRAYEQKLLAGGRVHFVAEQDRVPAGGTPSDAYTLVDVFGQYTFKENAVLNVNIDNLLDVAYRPFLYQESLPGLSARIGMTLRFGATPDPVAR